MKERLNNLLASAAFQLSRLLGAAPRRYLSPLRTGKPIRKILFVCKGNICRSPYAEVKLRSLLRDPSIEVRSAGLDTTPGKGADDCGSRVAAKLGVDLSEHRTASMTPELPEWADLIVVMDQSHRDLVAKLSPDAVAKTIYLGALAPTAAEGPIIPDPYGRPDSVFEACYSRINRALEMLVKRISA